MNFQGPALGLEHEHVKCTSQTIQSPGISWQVLGDDTRELEERQAVRLYVTSCE